jgi:hypothetical protein
MPHSFLIFDFGTDEDLAQQARQRIAGWKQGFRLDKKLEVKFEREDADGELDSATQDAAQPASASAPAAKGKKSAAKGKGKASAKPKAADDSDSEAEPEPTSPSQIRLIVRLDFSDHEKLTHQRWIERIPTEEPFKAAKPQLVRADEPEFKATSDLFDSLD